MLDTVRDHRWGMASWVVGSVVGMVSIAAGLARELRDPEAARRLAAGLEAGVRAMRPLRWPAERLDTVGGYLTYHNVILFLFGIAVYAGVQGVRAVRAADAEGVVEELLAAGCSRRRLLVDRAAGFVVVLAVIWAGLAGSLIVATALAGEPQVAASTGQALAVVAAGFAAYGFGAVVAQIAPSARAATGVVATTLTAGYVLTNVAEDDGVLGVLRHLTPFFWALRSRPLVPGDGTDVRDVGVLAAGGLVALAVAVVAFERRDVPSGLWRTARASRPDRAPGRFSQRVQRPALHRLWTATLARQRLGLVAWSASCAAVIAVLVALERSVLDLWTSVDLMRDLMGADPAHPPAEQYFAFSGEIVVPVLTAYVVTQAAGWVADAATGRDELLLAAPLARSRLVLERLLAVLVGGLVITFAGLAMLAGGSRAVGSGVDPAGVGRLLVCSILLTAALAAVAVLAVTALRGPWPIVVVGTVYAASYLVMYLAPLLGWPDAVTRLSVFVAFGTPYLAVPPAGGLAVLAGLAVGGTALAITLARGGRRGTSAR